MQQNQNDQINELKDLNVIYKVKLGQSLILRPGGNIIILPTLLDQKPLLGYQCQLYINQINYISIPNDLPSNLPSIYIGQIDGVTFLPNGQGEIHFNNDTKFFGQFKEGFADGRCNIYYNENIFDYRWGWKHGPFEYQLENNQIKGNYKDNLLHGELIKLNDDGVIINIEYYYNNVKVEYPIQENNKQQTTRYLFNHKEFSITNYTYLGLNEENWINQILIDYYLELIQDYYRIMNPDKKILLINTIMSQDIFSSFVSDSNISIQIPQMFQDLHHQNPYNRIIIVLNVNRAHFVTFVFQNNTLFLLNSMSYYDEEILDKVLQLFSSSEKKIDRKILKVPQQLNGCDCALYSIFNVLLQYLNIDIPVDEIDYSVTTPQKTSYLRQHLRNVFLNDYTHLIPIYN